MLIKRFFIIYFFFSTLAICLFSCENGEKKKYTSQIILGRSVDLKTGQRISLYRAKVPNTWSCHEQVSAERIHDSTFAIAAYYILDGSDAIQITIHNFINDPLQQRVPLEAQVSRWQKQFTSINKASLKVIPQAFSGFVGIVLDMRGKQKAENVRLCSWALQLAKQHYSRFNKTTSLSDEKYADVTIKAIGSEELMRKYKDEIFSFARSFELIEALPMPL